MLTGVSNDGTLGVGGNTSPGLVFDPVGTGSFSGKPDYLTPGSPAEGFSVSYNGGSVLINNNTGTQQIGAASTPSNVSGSSSYDNAVQWTGTITDKLTVEHVFAFDNDQKNIAITTTLTALDDLADLEFARWIDPDSGGTSSINNRGNSAVGLAPEDWVNSVSETNGATLGLYSESATTHNTGFTYSWSQDPADYIAGGFNADGTTTQHTGDDMIGVGFNIGTLSSGDSVVLEYAYVVTADENDLDVGVGKWIGTSNNDWDNNANWNPERAPTDGENVFIESSGNATVNHNVAGNTYGDWTFHAGGAAVTVQGNNVTLADGKSLSNNSSFLQTFAVHVATAGNLSVNAGGGGLSFQNIQVADGSALAFDTGSSNASIVAGVISGASSAVTVTGSGTVQFFGSNTYSGGTNLNGGTLRAAADSNLGHTSGALSFGGGTLGLTADFSSARPVTVNAGGGTINTGAFEVTFSGEFTGTGALTKTGTGKLTLSGTNSYSGGTTVAAGTLAGNTASLPGDIVNNAAVEFHQANDGTYAGSISGSGSVTKLGTGTLTFSGNHTYTGDTQIQAGGLTLVGTSTSNVTVGAAARFGGNATVADLDNRGTVAPGNSIGTTVVTGDYTHDADATYEVEINDAGDSDLIDVSGTATINGGTVDVQPEPGTYTPGIQYTILEADGGVTGTFDTLSGSVAGVRLELVYNPLNVQLLLAPLYGMAARTPNQRAVAGVLEALAPTAAGDLAAVLGQLDSVIDDPRGAAYLDQLGGELYGTAASIAVERTSWWLESIERRLRSVEAYHAFGTTTSGHFAFHQGSAGTEVVRGQSGGQSFGYGRTGYACAPWVQGYGIAGEIDGDGNAAGSDYSIGGTTVGVDRRLDTRTLFGVAGGYGSHWIEIARPDQQASVDSGQVAAYLHRSCDACYVNGLAAFAHHGYESARRLAFGELSRTASGDFVVREFACRMEIGRCLQYGRLQWQPYAALQYIDLHQEAFAETGAGAVSLAVDAVNTDSLRSLLGSRLVSYYRFAGSRVLAPELHALWRHEYLDATQLVGADFTAAPGNSFVVAGADAGRDVAVLGGACTFYLSRRVSLFADYDLLLSGPQRAHAATGGAQILW